MQKDKNCISEIKRQLIRQLKVKNFGKPHYYLKIEISYEENKEKLSTIYTKKVHLRIFKTFQKST